MKDAEAASSASAFVVLLDRVFETRDENTDDSAASAAARGFRGAISLRTVLAFDFDQCKVFCVEVVEVVVEEDASYSGAGNLPTRR